MPFAVTSDASQKVVGITANPVNDAGNPALVDGPLRITITSGDATVVQNPATPLSFDLVSGVAGITVYDVEADADLGAGVTLIKDTVTYTVSEVPVPQATSFGSFTAGTITAK